MKENVVKKAVYCLTVFRNIVFLLVVAAVMIG